MDPAGRGCLGGGLTNGGGMGSLRDELEGLIGPEGLRALSEARGGRRLYVPRSVRAGHWLAEALGLEVAEQLAFQYGGCRIDVPSTPPPSDRNGRIRALRRAGVSTAGIAAAVRLSERQIRRILRD